MTASRRSSPVERFLGARAAVGGPFLILGLESRVISDEVVISSLEARLAALAAHPERDTPEADEVRLALHAAAAQLLDPKVRRLLEAKWRAAEAVASMGEARAAAAPEARSAVRRPGLEGTDVVRALEHDAVLTLGLMGGWNRKSLRRLAALAHARGATASDVTQALRAIATRPARAARPGAGAARPPEAAPGVSEGRGSSAALSALVVGIGLVVCAGIVLLAVMVLLWHGKEDGPIADSTMEPPPVRTEARGEDPPVAWRPSSPRPAVIEAGGAEAGLEAGAIVRELSASVEGLATDPDEAFARFGRGIGALEREWVRMNADQLAAAQNQVVEFVYRSRGEAAVRAVEVLASGAGALSDRSTADASGVRRAVFSIGILARLARERDLPIAASIRVESVLSGVLGHERSEMESSFAGGTIVAAKAVPSRLVGTGTDREAWASWRGICDAVGRNDPGLRSALILSGLETLLIQAEEASSDRAVHDTIADLVLAVTWRESDESRRRVLRWFDDQRISVMDLHRVTSVLATRSSAERVDVTMVLSAAATPADRADLRSRYARAWGVGGVVERDQVLADWTEAARQALERSRAASTDLESLAAAVELATLNTAAEWHTRGDSEFAARLVGGARVELAGMVSVTRRAGGSMLAAGDGMWAVRYASVGRSTAARLERLNELRGRSGELGSVDAEVLVGEALLGVPAEVRARAAEIVQGRASEAAIVNAVLEALPRTTRSVDARLIEAVAQKRLPSPRSADWGVAARRALVERLLEVLSGTGDLAVLDELAALLARAYHQRASDTPLSSEALRAMPALPDRAASRAWVRARREVARPTFAPRPVLTLEQIDLRRSGRHRVAQGMVQAFAADQVSLVEVLAYAVSLEGTGEAEKAGRVLAEFAEERRRARTIVEQINVTERGATRLWLVRVGEAVP